MVKRKDEEASQQSPFRLHGDLLTTTLLAFLRNWNAYGYQLSQRLAEAGLPAFDSGTVYRTLRQLERTGLVSSFWDTSESGPARRMYSLTKAGDLFLSGWIDVLGKYQAVLQKTIEDMEPQAAAETEDEGKPRRAARG
jgi:poly-beta-hydroxybutyrate-responsive repressor